MSTGSPLPFTSSNDRSSAAADLAAEPQGVGLQAHPAADGTLEVLARAQRPLDPG